MPPPKPRSPRNRNPLALDVAVFCRDAGAFEGQWALTELPRLAESVVRGADGYAEAPVQWAASGHLEPAPGDAAQSVLELRLATVVVLECQRCLQAMALPLHLERRLRFVQGEDEAARLDEELEDDVLALTSRLDLRALAEDELLLSLPLVPRHENCPNLPAALRPEAESLPEAAQAGAESAASQPGKRGSAAGAAPASEAGDSDDTSGGSSPKPHPFAALAALRGLKR